MLYITFNSFITTQENSVCEYWLDVIHCSLTNWHATTTLSARAFGFSCTFRHRLRTSLPFLSSTLHCIMPAIRPSVGLGVHFGDVEPAVIESERAGFAGRILNAHDASAVVAACVLDNVEPVRLAVSTGTLELCM